MEGGRCMLQSHPSDSNDTSLDVMPTHLLSPSENTRLCHFQVRFLPAQFRVLLHFVKHYRDKSHVFCCEILFFLKNLFPVCGKCLLQDQTQWMWGETICLVHTHHKQTHWVCYLLFSCWGNCKKLSLMSFLNLVYPCWRWCHANFNVPLCVSVVRNKPVCV